MVHAWPGNVRELENAIQRIVSMSRGVFLGLTNLPSSVARGTNSSDRKVLAMAAGASSGAAASTSYGAKGHDSMGLTMAALERIAIVNAVSEAKGNMGLAALRLRIGRTTLYRKIRQYQEQGYLSAPTNKAKN